MQSDYIFFRVKHLVLIVLIVLLEVGVSQLWHLGFPIVKVVKLVIAQVAVL